MTHVYDGNNKQIEVKNAGSQPIGDYRYDGDGKRVKKYVPNTGETTIFVYDLLGKLVAEYSTLLNPTPRVSYLTTDHLGSPRINTDQNGAVISRHDYHPFGEEISTSQRTTGNGYTPDNIRKQFTRYEKDDETDLNFAQARYQNDIHGRFTSPDPLMASASKINPQTFNRYSYVRNNPLNLVDPTGMCPPEDDEPCINDARNGDKLIPFHYDGNGEKIFEVPDDAEPSRSSSGTISAVGSTTTTAPRTAPYTTFGKEPGGPWLRDQAYLSSRSQLRK